MHPSSVLCGADPDRQRRQPPMQEERRQRVQESAGGDADPAEPGGPLFTGGHDARDHVAVSAQELGGAVEHHRRPVLERALENRGHERRVHHHRDSVRLPDGVLDVDQAQGGVARRLEDHEGGVGSDGRRDAVRGHERHLVTEQAVVEERVAAPVERTDRHHVVLPLLARGQEHRGESRHAGGKGHRLVRSLQGRQGRFVASHRGVVEPGVDGAAGRVPARRHGIDGSGGLLEGASGVGRGQVDGRGVDPLLGEVLAAGVDRQGVERELSGSNCLRFHSVYMVPIRSILSQPN